MRTIDEVKSIFEREYFKPFEGFEGFYWASGGAIVDAFIDQPINDVDVCFPSKESQEKALQHMTGCGFRLTKVNPTHYKVTNDMIKYDLLHTWGSPDETVTKYDYEHCCVAIDRHLNFVYHDNFFDRLKDKRLKPTNPDNFNEIQQWPVANIRRLLKFLKRGYTIDMAELIIVCQKVIDLQDKK